MILEIKCWQIRLVQIFPKKGLILRFSKTFYPKLQIFIHGYICHIGDILQLWAFLGLLYNDESNQPHNESLICPPVNGIRERGMWFIFRSVEHIDKERRIKLQNELQDDNKKIKKRKYFFRCAQTAQWVPLYLPPYKTPLKKQARKARRLLTDRGRC